MTDLNQDDLVREIFDRMLERFDRDGWYQGSMSAGSCLVDRDRVPKCIAGHKLYATKDVFLAHDIYISNRVETNPHLIDPGPNYDSFLVRACDIASNLLSDVI